jgi:ABC-2 type transport system ATP-binding protein
MEYVLQTFNIVKKYNKQKALAGVNMNIQKGDIYGFVGENGSGKTTIIRLITGLIFADEGSYELFGVSNKDKKILESRKKVGAVVETPSIYRNMTAYENLKTQCLLLGVNDENKIKEVLEIVGLADLYDSKKQAGNFSLGMRQRLGIAMALLNEPEFLILDEPMNGLDPEGIVSMRELIIHLNKNKNITFLISSHILTELSLIANRYGIISKGKIIKEISYEDMKKECRKSLYIQTQDIEKLVKVVEGLEVDVLSNGVKVYGDISINELLNKIIKAKVQIDSINSNESSLEEYYLDVIRGEYHG